MKFELPTKITFQQLTAFFKGSGGSAQAKPILPKSLQLNLRMAESSRYFSGKVFENALMSIDKVSLWIVSIVWIVAAVAMGMAFITVRGAADIKLKVETARALEPMVPKINRNPLSREQYDPLLQRVKKQYPTLTYEITSRPSLRISSNVGEQFDSWLNAIGYTDSLVPAVRWSLIYFCAGTECPGAGIMQADLIAETINISQPEGGGEIPPAPPAASAAPPPAH
jgi:hypothetical protein